MTQNDITDNIKLICPTNHYSTEFYDPSKKTLILIKNDDYYEPIYAFEDIKENKREITRIFSITNKKLLPNLKETLLIIKNLLNKNCGTLPSLPNVYKFKENIILAKLLYVLREAGYILLKQVLNYNGKVIGVLVTKGGQEGYIPCYPSSLIIDIGDGMIWIDEVIWKSYIETREFLFKVNLETNKRVLCAPKFKVIEEQLIIGIITETNQFIGINPPEVDQYGDDLQVMNESNYIVADSTSLVSDTKDEERIRLIKNIKLETSFYNAFRNTIRILLGRTEYREFREEILTIVNQRYLPYQTKLAEVQEKLQELTKDAINFIIYNEELVNKLSEITTCLVKPDDSCKNENYCLLSNGNNCKLQIPKTNLITGSDNAIEYFGKMADELIRYSRIRHFIFEPQIFLSFSTIKYNLAENEILVIQSLLNQNYFSNITISADTNFVDSTAYDTVNPQKTIEYAPIISYDHPSLSKTSEIEPDIPIPAEEQSSIVSLSRPTKKRLTLKSGPPQPKSSLVKTASDISSKELTQDEEAEALEALELLEAQEAEEIATIEATVPEAVVPEAIVPEAIVPEAVSIAEETAPLETSFNACKKVIQKILGEKWKHVFPRNTTVINYKDELAYCTFEILFDIIKNFIPDTTILRINQLKEILIEEYNNYDKEIYKIGHILQSQGKIELANKLLLGQIRLDIAIMSENYYITNLDLILLARHFNLPIVLLSSKILKENNKSFAVINKSSTNEYYFILTSPAKADSSSPYKLFSNNRSIKINLNQINLPLQTDIKIANEFNLIDYINKFQFDPKKSKLQSKAPRLTIIEKSTKQLPTVYIPTIPKPTVVPVPATIVEKSVTPDSDEDINEEALIQALEDLNEKPLIQKPVSQ